MVFNESLRPWPDFSAHFGVELNWENFNRAMQSFAIGFDSAAFMRESWRKRNTLRNSRMDIVRGEILSEERYAREHAKRAVASFNANGENARLILAALKNQRIEPLEQAALHTASVLETVDLHGLEGFDTEGLGGLRHLELQWLIRSHLSYITLRGIEDERPDLTVPRFYSLQYLLHLGDTIL